MALIDLLKFVTTGSWGSGIARPLTAAEAATAELGHLILHAHERLPAVVGHVGQERRLLAATLRLRPVCRCQ